MDCPEPHSTGVYVRETHGTMPAALLRIHSARLACQIGVWSGDALLSGRKNSPLASPLCRPAPDTMCRMAPDPNFDYGTSGRRPPCMSYSIFRHKPQVFVEIEEIPWSGGAKSISPHRFRISSRTYFNRPTRKMLLITPL